MSYIILATSLYLLIAAMVINTNGFWFHMMFRAVPVLLALPMLYHAVKSLGWLQYL